MWQSLVTISPETSEMMWQKQIRGLLQVACYEVNQ